MGGRELGVEISARAGGGSASGSRIAAADPVDVLRGIGPAATSRLAAAGIRTVGDLLAWFPRRHRRITEIERLDELSVGTFVRLRGRVERVQRSFRGGSRCVVTVTFAAPDGGRFAAPFFNQPWLRHALTPGAERQVEGRLERERGNFVVTGASLVPKSLAARGACVVHYPPIDGLSDSRLRALIDQALRRVSFDELADPLPPALAELAMPFAAAVRAMHQPADVEQHERARRGFALREAIALFRELEQRRRRRGQRRSAPVLRCGPEHDERMRRVLGFAWTPDQRRAVETLRARLAAAEPMALLLHGDVGSGKTAVALDAMTIAVAAGAQVAFLAPTGILAVQHHDELVQRLSGEPVRIALLVAGRPPGERRDIEARIAAGEVDLVVGTHALLSERTRFSRLGLVVVDEQHRFGVAQRAALAAKGPDPHVLVMTATPIPRTSALVRFGDLDVAELRSRPGGRRPAPAVFVPRRDWPRVVAAIGRHLRRRGRVFVVCPRIGAGGEKGGALRMHAELSRHFACAVVHGELPADERRARTAAFRDGAIDVLVGTTLLEVGLDVPAATLIVVAGAERFGLSQLHQLRGRVGRGARRGLCVLTGERDARVAALCRSRDGFALAEEDLRLRGAGELLGRRQSGAIDFRALDPVDDYDLLRSARDAVRAEAPPCAS